MRFRTRQRPRGLLRPGDQRRLVLLIAGLGLILASFTLVRRPQFWDGMFPDDEIDATPAVSSQQDHPPQLRPSDTVPSIQHDEFLTGNDTPASTIDVTARRIPLAELPDAAVKLDDRIPRVPDELLRTVRDDVIGVHSAETDAYYASMKMASKLSDQHRRKAPRGAYALFLDAPAGSRGVAYRIEGQLRQLSIIKGRVNAYGVGRKHLFDAWLTTPDSGDKLVHVVSMMTDKSLEQMVRTTNKEQSIRFLSKDAPRVHFTGYFFKREGYASYQEEGLSVAPLFVAGSLFHEIAPKVVSTRADQITPYLGWLTLLVSIGVVFMVWSFTASDVAHAHTRTHQLTKLPAVASFDDVTSVTVAEALHDMQVESSRPLNTLDTGSV